MVICKTRGIIPNILTYCKVDKGAGIVIVRKEIIDFDIIKESQVCDIFKIQFVSKIVP